MKRRPGYGLAEQLRSTDQGQSDNREGSSHRYTIIPPPWRIAARTQT
jgi:hypothetical protein